jgi:hypothetical protein
VIPAIVLGIIVVILYFILRPEEEHEEQMQKEKANLSSFKFPDEIPTIFSVVEAYLETYKNTLNLYPLLVNPYAFMLAVRMCEQGRKGREFGVMAQGAIDTDLETQAEWTMSTLIKDTKRWYTDTLANGKRKVIIQGLFLFRG